jgi:hypothetical protein
MKAPWQLDQATGKIRFKHHSIRTETQYVECIKRLALLVASGQCGEGNYEATVVRIKPALYWIASSRHATLAAKGQHSSQ